MPQRRDKPSPWNWSPAFLTPEFRSIARGLAFMIPLWERGGDPYDVVRKRHLNRVGTFPTAGPYETGEYGWGARTHHSDDDGWQYPSTEWMPTTAATMLVWRMSLDATARNVCFMGAGPHIGGALSCNLYQWSDNVVYWDFGGIGGNNRVTWSPGSKQSGLFIVRAGTQGTSIWFDGIRRANKTVAITRGQDDNETWEVFQEGAFGSEVADNAYYPLAALWSRELSDNEIQRVSEDPFGLLRIDWSRFMVKAPAAGGGGLSIPVAMHHYKQMMGVN